jgi:hypothetical protein
MVFYAFVTSVSHQSLALIFVGQVAPKPGLVNTDFSVPQGVLQFYTGRS